MLMVYKVLLSCVLLLWLQGCDDLLRNSELKKMKKEELTEYYTKNKKALLHIVDICQSYPQIKRVEKDVIIYYGDDNVSKDINLAAKDIRENIKKLKIDNVNCIRDGMHDNVLDSISFGLYSSGIAVSGEAQFIKYETKELRKYKKVDIPWQTVFPLPDEGWLIVFTK